MRVGVALPHGVHSGMGLPAWPHLRDLAVTLETVGFDALWVSDHYFQDHQLLGGPPGPGSQLDAMVVLPALAEATHRATLGTLVLAVGFRPPSVLAKAAASLDRLSAGRFVLGLGAGWHQAEYAAAGLEFPAARDRLVELEEAVNLIREMTSHQYATVTGRRFRVDGAPNLPQAAQAAVPILVAGGGPRALRIAARSADVWNVSGRYSPERYAGEKAEFERACEEVGRDPDTVRKSLGLIALVGENESDVHRRFEEWRQQAPWLVQNDSPADVAGYGLVGTPQQVGERVGEYLALGVTDLVLSFSPLMFGWCSAAGWDIVAQELLPV
jgi:alkanesulfonate monooxygenase SsuD/methylene tetrahydromethanopterin reductase-like flavin-dependent oxidoreductase (luciferase family)